MNRRAKKMLLIFVGTLVTVAVIFLFAPAFSLALLWAQLVIILGMTTVLVLVD